jgi:ribonuclease HI
MAQGCQEQGGRGKGGVIYDPKIIERTSFTWGLDQSTNNQAKVLTLYMGLKLIISDECKEVMVIGDSKLIIKRVRKQTRHGQHYLTTTIKRILKEGKALRWWNTTMT